LAAYRETTCKEELVDAIDEVTYLQEAYFAGRITSRLLQGVVHEFLRDLYVSHLPEIWEVQFRKLLLAEIAHIQCISHIDYPDWPIRDALQLVIASNFYGSDYLQRTFSQELQKST
jgi:hypothetical protein